MTGLLISLVVLQSFSLLFTMAQGGNISRILTLLTNLTTRR